MIFRITDCYSVNFLRLLASAFHLFLCLHSELTLRFPVLHLRSYRNNVKDISGGFKNPAKVDLMVLKMIVNFWRFQNGRHYKRGKLVSYFLNNAAKTCLYELRISEKIEIGHFFQSRIFFRLGSNLHTSCLSAFKLCSCFV